jgi:hypothetical protein
MKHSLIVFITLLSACSQSTETSLNDVRSVVEGILDADNHADIERVYHIIIRTLF